MKKTSAFYYLLASLVGCLLTIFIYNISAKSQRPNSGQPVLTQTGNSDCSYKLSRLSGYKYVHPLLFINRECESDKYSSLKSELTNYLNEQHDLDQMSKVSVYLCDLNTEGEWMGINSEEAYSPGSLLKVVLLITHLKAAETNPGILDKKIKFDPGKKVTPPNQHYNSKTIVVGQTYTVRELLKYMIAYSDNYATWLLNDYVDKNELKKTFTDFGFAQPNLADMHYTITTHDYSMFMRALYSAGYLTIASSEFAISLLAECDFKEGIAKGLPPNVIVAHKFGEAGSGGEHQLHESAIIFLGDKTYLLTVMTKGQNVEHQAEILSNISNMVYSFMKGPTA